MKKIYILTGLLFLSVTLFGQGIQFEKGTLAFALKKAGLEKKMVFIDAYAVWCGPCHKMDSTVFRDKEVGQYFNEHIVALKIDVERGEGKQIKKDYAIEGLPGYVFLDAQGNVVYREQGAKPTAVFMDVVKKAYAAMLDPNSIGRLAARYLKEKNDEQYLALYLDKLAQGRSTGYTDVLEQYLSVQKNIAADSRAMAKLIDDHNRVLIYGGKADEIIHKNLKSDGWQSYVRKDVRERFQQLPKKMGQNTSDYAILKRDTSYIDVALRRAKEEGMNVVEGQRESLMIHYYKMNGMGASFMQAIYPQIETLYKSLDVEALYKQHLTTIKKYENEPKTVFRTNAMIASEKLRLLVKDYGQFAKTDKEKANVLKWAKAVYGLTPDKVDAISFYANVLYLFADKKEGLKLKEKAQRMSADSKGNENIEIDYQLMKKNQLINL